MRRTALPVAQVGLLALVASSQVACSLLESDFEGSVDLLFQIDDEDNRYEDIETFDPNSNDDFRENRDRIREGRIVSMLFQFQDLEPSNGATLVLGQADVRSVSDPNAPWTEGVSAWEGVQVIDANTFFVEVPGDRQARLSELVFEAEPGEEALQVRVNGLADRGPVRFKINVTLNLEFRAGLL